MHSDLKQLLLDTHRGDERAARGLWNAQAPRLLRYARAVVGVRADAEDVLQGVFCRVLQMSRAQVEQVNDPAAWLAQATRRQAINELRSRRREQIRRAGVGGVALEGHTPRVYDAELEGALAGLPRRLREIVVLKHVAGLTFDQIEAATGVNRNTASSRYQAGVERLQTLLSPPARNARVRSTSIPSREVRHAR